MTVLGILPNQLAAPEEAPAVYSVSMLDSGCEPFGHGCLQGLCASNRKPLLINIGYQFTKNSQLNILINQFVFLDTANRWLNSMEDNMRQLSISKGRRHGHFALHAMQTACSLAVALAAVHAGATTYVYVGQPYADVSYPTDASGPNDPNSNPIISGPAPAPYNATMRVLGRFETASRLAGNMAATQIENQIQSWNFSDGLLSYTPANSVFVPSVSDPSSSTNISGSTVTTDSLGNVNGSFIWLYSPAPPHAVGQKINTLMMVVNMQALDPNAQGSGAEAIANQATCVSGPQPNAGNLCGNATLPATAFFIGTVPGTWSSFDPVPGSGQTTAGSNAVAMPNIAASDGVNGAPATVGSGGSAIVSPLPTWPAGISLDPASGAVNVAASVAAGTYSLPYRLCDSQSPLACVDTTATVVVRPATNPPGPATATPVPALDGKGLLLTALGLGGLAALFMRRRRS